MISITGRGRNFTSGTYVCDIANRSEQVQAAINHFRQCRVEVLPKASHPFRSFAAQFQQLEMPNRLHNIYNLEKFLM